jgi:hypothetical protein
MQHRNELNGVSAPVKSIKVADTKVAAVLRDDKYAKAEITRLKLELAHARDELEALSYATSKFVHFML